MLETKIKEIIVAAIVAGSALVTSCQPEYTTPSPECCAQIACSKTSNTPICAGDGNDCYCRKETCCDSMSCYGNTQCVTGYQGQGCMCEQIPNDKY
ncbi:MAG: hypothetical protein AABX04_01135 [Nanoarchaeota archaeon]